MLVPKFALVCCCCCTHALLVRQFPSIGSTVHHHGVETVLAEAIEVGRMTRAKDSENQPTDDFIINDSTVEGAYGSYHQEDYDHDDIDHDDHDHEDDNTAIWTKANSYGYATLANFIITLTSLTGIFIILCTEKCSSDRNHYIFDFFITLAASTMLGDAFFHILPKVLGLHVHAVGDDHDHDHDHDEHDEHDDHDDSEYMDALGKIGVIMSVMYAFWAFETLVCLLGGDKHTQVHPHMPHHTHVVEPISESDDKTEKSDEKTEEAGL